MASASFPWHSSGSRIQNHCEVDVINPAITIWLSPQNSNLEFGMSKVWRKKPKRNKKGKCQSLQGPGPCHHSLAARWRTEELLLLWGTRCHTDLGTTVARCMHDWDEKEWWGGLPRGWIHNAPALWPSPWSYQLQRQGTVRTWKLMHLLVPPLPAKCPYPNRQHTCITLHYALGAHAVYFWLAKWLLSNPGASRAQRWAVSWS